MKQGMNETEAQRNRNGTQLPLGHVLPNESVAAPLNIVGAGGANDGSKSDASSQRVACRRIGAPMAWKSTPNQTALRAIADQCPKLEPHDVPMFDARSFGYPDHDRYVYIARVDEMIKIGIAEKLEARMRALVSMITPHLRTTTQARGKR
jgi:hypothetical protein